MIKYVLKSNGNFLHFDCGGVVEWHNINPTALCAFDTSRKAERVIKDFDLKDVDIETENFSNTFFD